MCATVQQWLGTVLRPLCTARGVTASLTKRVAAAAAYLIGGRICEATPAPRSKHHNAMLPLRELLLGLRRWGCPPVPQLPPTFSPMKQS